jgi:NADPH2:quinone reductase
MHDALSTNGSLSAGERVLVHAATSGVGVTGVALAALLGASVVYATSRSAAKLAVLGEHLRVAQQWGLPNPEVVAVDTTAVAFERVASEVDVIVDNVGAPVLAGNLAAAAVGGRIVQVGRLGGGKAEIDLEEVARKRLRLVGVTFRTRTPEEVSQVVRRAAAEVGPHLPALRPRIAGTWPRSRLTDALEALGRDEHVGKLVVVHDRPSRAGGTRGEVAGGS